MKLTHSAESCKLYDSRIDYKKKREEEKKNAKSKDDLIEKRTK